MMTGPVMTCFASRLVGLLLVLLCALPFVGAQGASEWKKFRSENFALYTNREAADAREVLAHLEGLRSAYRSLTAFTMEDREITRVVLFRTKAEYERYALGTFSEAYYINARDRNHIVLSGLDANARQVLNHEYFHLFSRHAGFDLPLWLEEGLADTYSTLRFEKDSVSIGLPVQNHLRFLNRFEGTPVPLGRLFAVKPAHRNYFDHPSTLILYAQSWALAHMTFLGKEMHGKSGEFFEKMRAGATSEAAYQQVYGLSVAELEERLARYVRQRRYQYAKRPLQGLGDRVEVKEEAANAWETTLLLTDLLAFTGRQEQAAERYRQLAKEHPTVAEIDEAQGYLAALQLDRQAAAQHFESAAAKGSDSDRTYHQLALLRCNYQRYEEQCGQWISRALELNPHNQQARRWAIGYTLNARRFEEALTLMRTVPGVDGREAPLFFLQMGYAYANLGQMEEARAAIRRGKEFAQESRDMRRLDELARMVESAAEYREQVGLLDTPEGEPLLAREQASEADGDSAGGGAGDGDRNGPSTATLREIENLQEALDLFLATEGNRAVQVTLLRMDCNPERPALEVQDGKAALRLAIDDPDAVVVFRAGERIVADALRCGDLGRRPALAGYESDDAPEGADGRLRILSFQ
jgi:Flp pilus assembly protein TadD